MGSVKSENLAGPLASGDEAASVGDTAWFCGLLGDIGIGVHCKRRGGVATASLSSSAHKEQSVSWSLHTGVVDYAEPHPRRAELVATQGGVTLGTGAG
jgi:hypothetical protein